MGKKIYLSLIMCTILSQAMLVLSEGIKTSSDIHLRKKRLIDKTLRGDRPVRLEKVPYIVSLRANRSFVCGAVILSANIVITAAHCLKKPAKYSIKSGSALRNFGTSHAVKSVQFYPLFNVNNGLVQDLALILVSPPIDLIRSKNRKIDFYNGPLHPGTPATLSGWGCTDIVGGRQIYPNELRSIVLPILSQEDCRNTYRNVYIIEDKDICTGGKEYKGTCFGDSGGPVVINGKLAGIMSWQVELVSSLKDPNVSLNLAYPAYRNWIISTMQHLEHIAHLFSLQFQRTRVTQMRKASQRIGILPSS